MSRDFDPRPDEVDRRELAHGGRGGGGDDRLPEASDPREVFSRDLALPRGPRREHVRVHAFEYRLRGSEVRTLSTVGAFRVVPAEELRRQSDGRGTLRKDVTRLRECGLVRTLPYVIGRERTTLVTLTDQGRAVLEGARRARDGQTPQLFYAGIAKTRELAHDVRLHRAYLVAAERLVASGSRVRRVVLDHELKRDYQAFLQAPNRGRRDSDGRPRRDPVEIAKWADAHQLPIVDDRVQFPDVRIEYEGRDGRLEIEDLEVMTPHYRGAHAAAKVRAGFTRYAATGVRVGGSGQSRRGGRARDAHLAEEMLG